MIYPGGRELIFSLKAFAAAMLSFWINCALNLPRPTWALFMVYALMQPASGAVRSAATYRMVGSLAGAAIVLVLLGALADFPSAAFLASSAVAFACFFVATIDRMPHGSAIALTGVTVAVIGLDTALEPLTAFPTIIARIEQVLLAILCVTLIDSVVFPHAAGVTLNARVATWLGAARKIVLRALDPSTQQHEGRDALAQLAIDAAALDALSVHVAYDSVPLRPSPRVVRLLHARMLRLIRLIYITQDWRAALRQTGQDTGLTSRAFTCVADWVAEMPTPSAERTTTARAAIDALQVPPDRPADATATLRGVVGQVLRDLMAACEDCLALQRAVVEQAPLPSALSLAARANRLSVPLGDPVRALLYWLPVTLAFLLVLAYYAATGWVQGPETALLIIVAGLYGVSADEPAKRLVIVAAVTTAAAVTAIVYQFVVLPPLTDFPILALALGLFFIPAGAFIPITPGIGLALCVLTAFLLGLEPEYDARFADVANIALGAVVGATLTAIFAYLTAVPGVAWTTRRLVRIGWSDIAAVAAGTWRPNQATYTMRALDRFTSLAPYLDAAGGDADLTTAALLAELRIGLNILILQTQKATVPEAARPAIEQGLVAIAAYFNARRSKATPDTDVLRDRVTAAITAATQAMPAPGAQTAWLMLAGAQRSLFGTTVLSTLDTAAHAR